jgi:hypothetical protein
MLRNLRRLVLLFTLVLTLPSLAADKDKGASPDKSSDEAKVRAGLLEGEYLEGKLTQLDVEGDTRSFTLVVTAKTRIYNQAIDARAIDLDKKLAEMKRAMIGKRATAEQSADMKKRAEELKDLQSKIYTRQDVAYEFALKAGKELNVRRQEPPPKIGDDGKPRTYSLEELKKLKGSDTNLPGWTAEIKELKKDAAVRVWLDRKSVEFPSAKKDGEPPTYTAMTIVLLPEKK